MTDKTSSIVHPFKRQTLIVLVGVAVVSVAVISGQRLSGNVQSGWSGRLLNNYFWIVLGAATLFLSYSIRIALHRGIRISDEGATNPYYVLPSRARVAWDSAGDVRIEGSGQSASLAIDRKDGSTWRVSLRLLRDPKAFLQEVAHRTNISSLGDL